MTKLTGVQTVAVPLSRAWCLWELHCTCVEGAQLSVCLGPSER